MQTECAPCTNAPASERPRVVLTSKIAREIFQLKATHGCGSLHAASLRLASKYGVSSKAIRDIWKGRSWLEATYDLWNVEERPARRVMGRPKGKKDSRPRTRGSKTHPEIEMPQLHDLSAISLGPHMTGMIGSQNNSVEHYGFTLNRISSLCEDAQYRTTTPAFAYIRNIGFAAEMAPFSLGESKDGSMPTILSPFCTPQSLALPCLPPQQVPQAFGTSPPLGDFFAFHGSTGSPQLPGIRALTNYFLAPERHWGEAVLAPVAPAGPLRH